MRQRIMLGLVLVISANLASARPVRAQEGYYSLSAFSVFPGEEKGPQSAGMRGAVSIYAQKGNRPIAMFGLHKWPNVEAKYLYFVIFKTPKDYSGKGHGGTQGAGNSGGDTYSVDGKSWLDHGKLRVDIGFKFIADRKTHGLLESKFKIEGKEHEAGVPLVFVVDLTKKDKVDYHAVKVELPKEAPGWDDASTWPKTVLGTIEQLKKKSPELRKLLE